MNMDFSSFTSNSNNNNPNQPQQSHYQQQQQPPQKPQKKVLKAADVIAKAKIGGVLTPDEKEEAPKLFTEDIYDDFQSALLKLEKRAKEGEGSLSLREVEEFKAETGRIVREMREFMEDPVGRGRVIAASYGEIFDEPTKSAKPYEAVASKPAIPSTTTTTPTTPSPTAVSPASSPSPVPPQAATKTHATAATIPSTPTVPSSPSTTTTINTGYGKTDISQDEGPAYSGEGGFGLAKGTTNTYVIPGMEEMSPEEYRAKLQETISARQAKRREESLKRRGGVIGNMSSSGYLANLSNRGGGTGASNNEGQGEKHPNNVRVVESEAIESDKGNWVAVGNTEEKNVRKPPDLVLTRDSKQEEVNVPSLQIPIQQPDAPSPRVVDERPSDEPKATEQTAGEESTAESTWTQLQSSEVIEEKLHSEYNVDDDEEDLDQIDEATSQLKMENTIDEDDDESEDESEEEKDESLEIEDQLSETNENEEDEEEPTQPSFRSIVNGLAQSTRRREVSRKSEWLVTYEKFSNASQSQSQPPEREQSLKNWWDEQRQRPVPKTKLKEKPRVLPRSVEGL